MSWTVYLVGFIAQGFYTGRSLIQWIKSEKSKKIESPMLYWLFSLIGSVFFFLYGYLREDFSVIFGEMLSFYIYIWNIRTKGVTSRLADAMVTAVSFLPLAVIGILVFKDADVFTATYFRNENLPLYAVLWGMTGQFIYKMRFVYQWYYSYRRHASILPIRFWWIAFIGSLMIIVYGIYRLDVIIVMGQVGILATIRNLMIGYKARKAERSQEQG